MTHRDLSYLGPIAFWLVDTMLLTRHGVLRPSMRLARALSLQAPLTIRLQVPAHESTNSTIEVCRAREALVPLIEKKLDGFVLWFFANKDQLEAKERGEACPHHDDPEACPSKNDASHACPFTRKKEASAASWTADECSEAEAHVERYVTKAERQLHLLEHALGPYARGERNSFHSPLRLTKDQEAVDVASFDALLAHYHGELAAQHGADPGTWDGDKDAQRLVMELTTQFLQAAEPDFRVEEQK